MSQSITSNELTSQDVMMLLAEALGTMAFVCAMPPDGPITVPEKPLLVRMAFHTPGNDQAHGSFELVAGEAFGHLLAGNMLGDVSATPTQAEAHDALRELMNVASGIAARQHAQAGAGAMAMGIPTVTPFDPAGWAKFAGREDAVTLDADGHAVAACFRSV